MKCEADTPQRTPSFPGDFPVQISPWFLMAAPRHRLCHYRLLVFAIMPCLLLSLPLAVARRLCNTAYDARSSVLLSP